MKNDIFQELKNLQNNGTTKVVMIVDDFQKLVSTVMQENQQMNTKTVANDPLVDFFVRGSPNMGVQNRIILTAASQHHMYQILPKSDQVRVVDIAVPMEPLDIYALKVHLMRRIQKCMLYKADETRKDNWAKVWEGIGDVVAMAGLIWRPLHHSFVKMSSSRFKNFRELLDPICLSIR